MRAHLDDVRLHVGAAPGAGKTVLELEIVRRFRIFESRSNDDCDLIANGLGRLNLDPSLSLNDQYAVTFALARDRDSTAAKWERSLRHGKERSHLRQTAAPSYAPRSSSRCTIIQAIMEVLGPVQNPRYRLVRRSWLGRVTRHDYHSIPFCFGTHKEKAECFA